MFKKNMNLNNNSASIIFTFLGLGMIGVFLFIVINLFSAVVQPIPKCKDINYIQRGRIYYMRICISDKIKILDSGGAYKDSTFMMETVKPIIDSLKKEIKK